MATIRLWTKNFIALVFSNALMFGGFHILLPTLPIYAAYNGATGSQIGLITGIFGFSAIFIRFFTDFGVRALGEKKCLYVGLIISFLCTVSYAIFTSVEGMIATRIMHGFGFGLTTTFYAAIAAEIIPHARRGEGMGYFGLGSTVAMALAPAAGVWLVNDYGFVAMFIFSALGTGIALIGTTLCRVPQVEVAEETVEERSSSLIDKLFERGTGFPAFLTMLFGVGYGSVNTFVAMLAKEANIPDSGYFFIVGTICVFLSRPIGGKVFDSKGPAWVVLPGSIFLLAGLVVLTKTTSLLMLLGVAVLYGFGGGFLLPALLTWMLNLVRSDRRSGASATFYNMLDVGTSAGAILLGTVAETTGFIRMYDYSAGAMGIFLVAFVIYLMIHGNNGKAKEELALAEEVE
ncbi:MAG: mdtG 2 [Firmicutes bacterium]|nr:mdtG 2 [Bacillota bacterium]